MEIKKIEQELFKLSTNNEKKYITKVVPNINNVIGVKVPDLRKLARTITKTDYSTFLKSIDKSYFEYEMLTALVIGYAKDDIDIILKYAKDFIPTIDNWAVNDIFCQNFKIAKKYPDKVLNFLKQYIYSDKEFEQRVVAVILLSHYLTDNYIDIVLDILIRLKHPGYYTKMAVAWAVATAYCKYPTKTLSIIKNKQLDTWTHNKAIQKCIESYRVTKEDKIILKKLKISTLK